MTRRIALVVFAAVLVLCALLPASVTAQRVLIVTTEQTLPYVVAPGNGENVIGDMVIHGFPFDLVTYGRFVNMELGDHDVIILNGHTTPTSVYEVAAKCQAAQLEGRKIFINGSGPFRQYDDQGLNPITYDYSPLLFGVINNSKRKVTGVPVVSGDFEKDPAITNHPVSSTYIQTYRFNTAPAGTLSIGGYAFGYVYPQGGMVDDSINFLISLVDYGKVVSYLRYGNTPMIGFSNDRMGGQQIAAFDVHCDTTKNLAANNGLKSLSNRLSAPLMCLLVYNMLDAASVDWWNKEIGPLMSVGSHSLTHPMDWTYEDINYQVLDALRLQRELIPATKDYFDPSGSQNLTLEQMDTLTNAGILCGANGESTRYYTSPVTGQRVIVHRLPSQIGWFRRLSRSTVSPFYLSYTSTCDHTIWKAGGSWVEEIKTSFAQNSRYGMYMYGYIHDYMMDPKLNYYYQGVHMSVHINNAFDYLRSQGVRFISGEQLIRRLNDFVAGRIDRVDNADGTTTVTVTRPKSEANDIKIGFKGDLTPAASGASVTGQRLAGEHLYVSLASETVSTVRIEWSVQPPAAPVVTTEGEYISNASSARWVEPVHPGGVAEYEYAVGETPGGTEAQDWTSAGTETSVVLSGARMAHGGMYYISVRARYSVGEWSPIGVSAPLRAEVTPPSTPIITDDGDSQYVDNMLHASWYSDDPESGIAGYKYAVGTTPGGTNVRDWTFTADAEVAVETGVGWAWGKTYYFSVQAQNTLGLWSDAGVSDGIRIMPDVVTVAYARKCKTGSSVKLVDCVVTAAFAGEFYVEDKGRPAAIKVISTSEVREGDQIDISGVTDNDDTDRIIRDAVIIPSDKTSVRPLFMCNSHIGDGSSNEVPGIPDSPGVGNIGLLVSTSGRILRVDTTCLYIDDGSRVHAGTDQTGIKVLVAEPYEFVEQQQVIVTGISALTKEGPEFRRTIRTRSNSDVVVRE